MTAEALSEVLRKAGDAAMIAEPLETVNETVALASALGVSRQYVDKAKRLGYMSPRCATLAESLYGVPREDLVDPKLRAFIVGEE